jgi:4-hydroxy-L-threonine phosphate dehydrogenase PdxA
MENPNESYENIPNVLAIYHHSFNQAITIKLQFYYIKTPKDHGPASS